MYFEKDWIEEIINSLWQLWFQFNIQNICLCTILFQVGTFSFHLQNIGNIYFVLPHLKYSDKTWHIKCSDKHVFKIQGIWENKRKENVKDN